MEILQTFLDPKNSGVVSVIFRLLVTCILSGVIGLERGFRGRAAGLRTHILVGIGSCVTAMTGIFIMNFVLVAAYLIEVLKGARTITTYSIIAVLCIAPCILAAIVFARKKEAYSIRYILGIGFSLFMDMSCLQQFPMYRFVT